MQGNALISLNGVLGKKIRGVSRNFDYGIEHGEGVHGDVEGGPAHLEHALLEFLHGVGFTASDDGVQIAHNTPQNVVKTSYRNF